MVHYCYAASLTLLFHSAESLGTFLSNHPVFGALVNVLNRYIVFEIAKVFLVTLSAMTALMILVGVVQEAVRENLTPLTILQLIPYVLPNALCFAIPGTILFSTCMVLGRMSASNEIIAIKSMGISPIVAIWPVLVMSFCLSLVTLCLNDLAVSWGRKGVYRVVLHSVEKTIYAVLNTQRNYQNGRVSIYVDDVVGSQLIRPVVQIYQDDTGNDLQFSAEIAQLSVNAASNELVFSVRNASFSRDSVNAVVPYDDVTIPLSDAIKKGERSKSPSNYPLRSIGRETVLQRQEVQSLQNRMAMQATFQMLGGDFVSLTHPRWNAQLDELQQAKYRVYRLQTEPWRRWANGFSCFCFVIVGAPLAIYLRKSDFWNTFALCFIPILIIYYPLLMFGVGQAKSGDLPPPIVWMGNIVLVAIGWIMIKRTMRN